MDLARYAQMFLTESQEHLQTINESLLELERSGFDAEHVDRFFRAVHTIKGMSATMGYDAVARLSHEMESLLSDVRDGKRSLDGDLLDPLFEATDALERAVVECAEGNVDAIDLGEAIAAIAAARSAVAAPLTRDRGARRRTTDAHPEVAAPSDALQITVRLNKNTPLPGVRAFLVIERLRTMGDVVAITPSTDQIQSDSFDGNFAVFLRSTQPETVIRKTVLASGDVEQCTTGSAAETPGDTAPDRSSAGVGTIENRRAADPAADVGAAPRERRGVKHVRVEQRRLDALMNLVGELVIARGRLARRAEELRDPELEEALSGASRQISELHDEIMASRMVPVWQVFDRFPRLVRDAARALDKQVDFVMEGRDIELDRSLLDEIGDPVVHLLRNAVDHGLESPAERVAAGKGEVGRLVLSAVRDRETVLFTVADDGRGMDREKILKKAREKKLAGADLQNLTNEQLFAVISTSGFSTAEQVTDISGRGVGVDAVVTRVRAMGGNIELHTEKGEGTTVTIRLPLTLAIIRAMLASVGDETFAIPLTHVLETLEVPTASFQTVRGTPVAVVRDEILPVRYLRDVVELPSRPESVSQMLVLEVGGRRAGLVVDELVGQQEVVVKQFDSAREGLPVFSGATILGNGELALIVDVGSII